MHTKFVSSYLGYLRGNIVNQRLIKIKRIGLDKIKQTSFQLVLVRDHCVHIVWLKLDKFCDSYFLPKKTTSEKEIINQKQSGNNDKYLIERV